MEFEIVNFEQKIKKVSDKKPWSVSMVSTGEVVFKTKHQRDKFVKNYREKNK